MYQYRNNIFSVPRLLLKFNLIQTKKLIRINKKKVNASHKEIIHFKDMFLYLECHCCNDLVFDVYGTIFNISLCYLFTNIAKRET
jgi:hypothetical protein